MPSAIYYDPSAARVLIDPATWDKLSPSLLAARDEVFADLDILASGRIPAEKEPLDAGCVDLPQRLLTSESELLDRIEAGAERFRDQVDRMLVLGIGGSYMGLRALFEALCNPYHNELPRSLRNNVPKLTFEGENLDNDAQQALLRLLGLAKSPQELAERWGIVVISKSGGTLETAAAFRIFRDELERYYGANSREATELVIPITGEVGRLRSLSNARGYETSYPIPDGVGGRFSVFTAVGLFPAAVLGIDIRALLQGAADLTSAFRSGQLGSDPVLDYVATCHLLERDHGMDMRVLSMWGKGLEAVGLWYDQLLAESLGKHERGATPLTVVNTRDLHSRGQQHQEGKRDRLITNVIVNRVNDHNVQVPLSAESLDQDQLNRLAGKSMSELMAAAIQGTNQAYAEDRRPTADIHLPAKDSYAIGQLLQMFMLATVLEGRLLGINPYGQPGVEGYKKNMGRILYG